VAKKKRKYPELTALKGRIREKKTSYRKLASELGMGLNTLSNKVNGFYPFNGAEMEKIAEILEIEPKDIASFFMPTYCKTHQRSA
jgi:lambda repressor-like predicted transcriptional regulator